MEPGRAASRFRSALAAALLWAAAGHAADPPPVSRASAIAMYDAGRYAEAAQAIVEIDRAGQADGALLYRLFYCQRSTGDAAATATLERARAELEIELTRAPSLETSFYLTNAYTNLRRSTDALRTANDALSAVESGKLPQPSTPFGRFALAKLYADAERVDHARRWYDAAFGEPADAPTLAPAYVRWAARYVGDHAYDAGEWDAAERAYARLVDAGEAAVATYDRLAVARARLGLWDGAAQAWNKVVRLDPANADRARYCAQIVAQARELGSLSAIAPDGRLWSGLSKEELESVLSSQVEVVRSARQEAERVPGPDDERRATLQTSVDAAHAVFIAAALEYALVGHDIRETAFIGGYAPLVFHSREWSLPQVEEPEPTPTADPQSPPAPGA
jgi:tetratricopeptide (TPR) repeat protein